MFFLEKTRVNTLAKGRKFLLLACNRRIECMNIDQHIHSLDYIHRLRTDVNLGSVTNKYLFLVLHAHYASNLDIDAN